MKINEDYVVLNFNTINYLMKLGYKCSFVKCQMLSIPQMNEKIDNKDNNDNNNNDDNDLPQFELYPSQFRFYYQLPSNMNEEISITLETSLHEPIRILKTTVASHMLCQSSFIRFRENDQNGKIWDESNTLLQLHAWKIKNVYVEVRLPNGCWPLKTTYLSQSSLMDDYTGMTNNDVNNNNNNNNDNKDNNNKDNNNKDDNNKDNNNKDNNNKNNNNIDNTKKIKYLNAISKKKLCETCYRMVDFWVPCEHCLKNKINVYYCNTSHLVANLAFHKILHDKQNSRTLSQSRGLVGLVNIGNSCYMNASLHCLSFIPELRAYFISDDYKTDVNIDNPAGHKGELAKLYSDFLKQTWHGFEQICEPIAMRKGIAKLNETWRNAQHQDAQEFVDWFIDGLNEDCNRVKKKQYYELPDSDGRKHHIVADEAWKLHLQRNQSIIVDLFQGQIQSTLECPNCDYTSVKFDAFSVLQLPIPEKVFEAEVHCLLFLKNLQTLPIYTTICVSRKATAQQLTEKIGERFNVSAKKLLVCCVLANRFTTLYGSARSIEDIKKMNKDVKSPVFIYEVESTSSSERKEQNLVQVRMNFRYRDDSDIYFTFPAVFDIQAPVTGAKLHEKFREKLAAIIHDHIKENPQKYAPIPAIQMHIKKFKEEFSVVCDDVPITLTNEDLQTVTINVTFEENDYLDYVNKQKALGKTMAQGDELRKNKSLSIEDCLKFFTTSEVLEDPWTCKSCKTKQQPSKQLHLWRLPDILIIQLKRFVGGVGVFGFGYGQKIDVHINFPVRSLDLSQYISEEHQQQYGYKTVPKYDLFAICNHSGFMEIGHYTCIVRCNSATMLTNFSQFYDDTLSTKESRKWYFINDEKIINVSEDQIVLKDAYLLFYRRRISVED